MSKIPLRWIIRRLPLFVAAFVTLFILTGWLSHRVADASAPRAVDNAIAQGQVAGPGMYDDSDPNFRYTGKWLSGNFYPNAYMSTMHYTSDGSARAALTFQGTGFILYRVTFSNRGLMDVYIDGTRYSSPSNYSDVAVWQAPLVINDLPDGIHTVQFANTSGALYLDIDAVRVIEGSIPPPATATAHPVTATIFVPPTASPFGALPNLSANLSQPLLVQANTNTPSPSPTNGPNSISSSPGIITPTPVFKALIYSGQETIATNNLYTVNPIAGDPPIGVSNVTTGNGFNYPVWSPDGKSVAFSDTAGNLQILNVATGNYSAPSTVPIGINSPVAWDPSGAKRIAYIDSASGNPLKVVDFTGATATIYPVIAATGTAVGYSQVSWNKQGNSISYQASGSSLGTPIDTISAACIPSPGSCVPVSQLDSGANSATNSDPAWSPDGQFLAYVSNRDGQTGGNNDVYVLKLTSGISTRITTSPTTSKHSPSWNIASNQLVYVDSQKSINLIDKANTTSPSVPVTIHSATPGSLLSVSWSPLFLGPPTITPTPSITPTSTATPITLTGSTLTADVLLPIVGQLVTFTFTVNNSSSFTLTNLMAQLQVNGTTMAQPVTSSPTAASLPPGQTARFLFSYVVTANDTCSLSPIASFSGTLPNSATVNVVLSQLNNGMINVQKIGLAAGGVQPSSGTTAIGQALTTTINVTNNGCLPENVSGFTLVNNTKTSDAVTSSGSATLALAAGNSATFTSTHTVTSADISTIGLINPGNNGLAMVSLTNNDRQLANPRAAAASPLLSTSGVTVSYTFTATGATTSGSPLTATVVSSSSSYTASSGTTNGTTSALSVTKAASVTSVAPGGSFTYTITVTNNTGSTVSSLAITDSLPTSVTPGSATTTAGTATVSNGVLTVSVSSLANGQFVTVTLPVTVSKSISTGTTISNTASASISGGTTVTSNATNVAVANGASSLPVTGLAGNQPTSFGLIVLVVLIASAVLYGISRYLNQRLTSK